MWEMKSPEALETVPPPHPAWTLAVSAPLPWALKLSNCRLTFSNFYRGFPSFLKTKHNKNKKTRKSPKLYFRRAATRWQWRLSHRPLGQEGSSSYRLHPSARGSGDWRSRGPSAATPAADQAQGSRRFRRRAGPAALQRPPHMAPAPRRALPGPRSALPAVCPLPAEAPCNGTALS